MPISISITFENLFEIALGKTEDVTNVTNKDIPEIIQYLQKKITRQVLQNVHVGLDPGNPGTALHRRNLNHTAKPLKLDWVLQARLDMQNYKDTKAGVVGEGIYICKLTPLPGASKLYSTITTKLPRFYIDDIETLQEYVVPLGAFTPPNV